MVKHDTLLSSANALDILKDYDIISDGTDNLPTRYLVNDVCVLLGEPNAYGSGSFSMCVNRSNTRLPTLAAN